MNHDLNRNEENKLTELAVRNSIEPNSIVGESLEHYIAEYERCNEPQVVSFRDKCPWIKGTDRYTHLIHRYTAKLLPHIPAFFMTSSIEFGLPPAVFNTIIEIDMLLLKGSAISHAFEVATTVETANKAVNDRYRNMFIAMPSLSIKTFLIVKDKDAAKAHQLVYSMANVKDGISKKVTIVHLSDLTKEKFEQLC